MKAGGTTVAVVNDFEGGFQPAGGGCMARIRAKGAYGPARYVVTPGYAAGQLWKQIPLEKAGLPSK